MTEQPYADQGHELGARADDDIKGAELRATTAETALGEYVKALELTNAALDAARTLSADRLRRLKQARSRLAECQGSTTPPPPKNYLIGSSAYGGVAGYNELVGKVGHDLKIRRSYEDPGTFPGSFDKTAAADDIGKRASCWSFKFATGDGFKDWPRWVAGDFDNALRNIFGSVPLQHLLYAAPHHEPDGGGGATADGRPADFQAGFRRLRPILNEINADRRAKGGIPIFLGPIVMRGTLVYRKLDMNIWIPPADLIDFVGWDGYGEGVPTLPWDALAKAPLDWMLANRPGTRTLWCETGPWNYQPGTRADWVADAVADAKDLIDERRLDAWMYWNSGQNSLVNQDEFDALGS